MPKDIPVSNGNLLLNFDSYYQFLLELEKLPRITKIKQMRLEKDKANEGVMKAGFTLSIFFDSGSS